LSGPTPIPADGVLLVSLRLCPACGDQARGGTEQCDGIDASACNGPCLSDCSCPTCGDGVKNQTTEACDGTDAAACAGLCLPDCTCPEPVCGDGIVEGSEECDGTVCAIPGATAGCRQESCTCCGYPCYQFGCCDPEETCMPYPTTGYCFKFTCNLSEECYGGFECIESPHPIFGTGNICAGLPGSVCVLPTFSGTVFIPCVPPASCQNNYCCSPAGEACTTNSHCCRGTCSAGTCT
jgi:hypothetical protein